MNFQSILGGAVMAIASFIWQPDLKTAKEVSKSTGHPILLNFSGSDWCGPCIRMHKDIFENEEFIRFSDASLVLLNADFPRNKKHQLDKQHQEQNDKLAEKYNPEGKFPFTVLLDKEGKIIKSWEGYPEGGLTSFMKELNDACHTNH